MNERLPGEQRVPMANNAARTTASAPHHVLVWVAQIVFWLLVILASVNLLIVAADWLVICRLGQVEASCTRWSYLARAVVLGGLSLLPFYFGYVCRDTTEGSARESIEIILREKFSRQPRSDDVGDASERGHQANEAGDVAVEVEEIGDEANPSQVDDLDVAESDRGALVEPVSFAEINNDIISLISKTNKAAGSCTPDQYRHLLKPNRNELARIGEQLESLKLEPVEREEAEAYLEIAGENLDKLQSFPDQAKQVDDLLAQADQYWANKSGWDDAWSKIDDAKETLEQMREAHYNIGPTADAFGELQKKILHWDSEHRNYDQELESTSGVPDAETLAELIITLDRIADKGGEDRWVRFYDNKSDKRRVMEVSDAQAIARARLIGYWRAEIDVKINQLKLHDANNPDLAMSEKWQDEIAVWPQELPGWTEAHLDDQQREAIEAKVEELKENLGAHIGMIKNDAPDADGVDDDREDPDKSDKKS